MAQSVKYLTRDFGSGHDLTVPEIELELGSMLTAWSLLGILSLSLSLPLLHSFSLSLSLTLKKKKRKLGTKYKVLSMSCKSPGTADSLSCLLPFLGSGHTGLLAVLATCQAHPTPGPLHLLFFLQGALFSKGIFLGWSSHFLQGWPLLTI